MNHPDVDVTVTEDDCMKHQTESESASATDWNWKANMLSCSDVKMEVQCE